MGCVRNRKMVTMGDRPTRVTDYAMEDFFRSAVLLYQELVPLSPKLPEEGTGQAKCVSTPSMPETHNGADAAKAGGTESGGYPTSEPLADDTDASGGRPTSSVHADRNFHTAAARVIMKVVCGARMARPDLLRAISYFAR